MTHPQIGIWLVPAEERPRYPNGWLVIQHTAGDAWQHDGTHVAAPALRRSVPISELDHLEAAIRRIREALRQEAIEAERRAREEERRLEALRRLAYRSVIYANPDRIEPSGSDRDGILAHLSVARVADDGADEEEARAGALAALRTSSGDTDLLRRTLDGLRNI